MPNEMRARLVELLANSGCAADADTFAELADHLIENGVILLPYKIGSKLYHNVVCEEEPQEYTVVGYYCEEEPKLVHSEFVYNGKTYSHSCDIDDEGKYYFTSKEQAVKGRKRNG